MSRPGSARRPSLDPADQSSVFAQSPKVAGGKGRNFKIDGRTALTLRKTADVNGSDPFSRPSTAGRNEEHQFAYDRVFGEEIAQTELYEQSCKPVVLSVLEGYNGTILAYGQTGTGKTYTMEGAVEGPSRGIIPRAAAEVFGFIQEDTHNEAIRTSKWLVRVSFCQIYNEKISDLLADGQDRTDLKIRETGNGGTYIERLSEHVVRGPADVYKLLAQGRVNRTSGKTAMNAQSSRSHAVFTIVVEHSTADSANPEEADVTVGKLHLVDLAGSERFEVSQESNRQKETVNINTSLSAFGKVVLALTSRGTHHIPYRDSKLTRLLQDSLGGNSKTTMVATVTAMSISYLETLSTLKFSNRAKSVKNVAQVNKDQSESAMLTAMQAEIKRLQIELAAKANNHDDELQIDLTEYEHLIEDSEKTKAERDAIQTELAKRQAEVERAERERNEHIQKIHELENKLVAGGTKIEETVEFKAAIAKERKRIAAEADSKQHEIEEERLRLEKEKADFEKERQRFRKVSERMVKQASVIQAAKQTLEDKAAEQKAAEQAKAMQAGQAATSKGKAPMYGSPHGGPTSPRSMGPGGRSPRAHHPRTSFGPNMHGGRGGPRPAFIPPGFAGGGRPSHPGPPGGPRPPGGLGGQGGPGSIRRASNPGPGGQPRRRSSLTNMSGSPRSGSGPPMLRQSKSDLGRAPPFSAYTEGGPVGRAGGPAQSAIQGGSMGPPPPHGIVRSVSSNNEGSDSGSDGDLTTTRQRPSVQTAWRGGDADNVGHGLDRVADAREAGKTDQEVALEQYAAVLQHPRTGIPLGTRRQRLTTYKMCFTGTDAAGWFMANMEGVRSPEEATAVGQQLLDLGVIVHVKQAQQFTVSDHELYQFRQRSSSDGADSISLGGRRMSRTGSRSSLASAQSRFGSLSRSRSSSRSSLVSVTSTATRATVDEEYIADFDDEGVKSPLHIACGQGDISAIKQLVQEFGVENMDSCGRTPVMYSVIGNKGKACRALIKLGADLNAKDDQGNTPLIWSACRGARDATNELLKMGADVAACDSEGRTAIHWATKLKRVECLELMLKCAYRVVVNKKDNEQLTALHWATMCDHYKHAAALLKFQADPKIGDGEARTPLHYAVSRGAQRCLVLLLEQCRYCINVADTSGRSPLHTACGEGSLEVVSMLLAVPGIDVNCTDQRLTTPLHWAAVCNRPDVVTALLEHGARVMARDASGLSPLHYATERGFHECANAMQRYGGSSSALARPVLSPTKSGGMGLTAPGTSPS